MSIARLINSWQWFTLSALAHAGGLVDPGAHSTLPSKRIPGLSSFNLDHLYTKVNLGTRVLEAKRKQTDTRCRHLDVLINTFDVMLRSDVIGNQATT